MPRFVRPCMVAVGFAVCLPLGCKPSPAPDAPRRDLDKANATTSAPGGALTPRPAPTTSASAPQGGGPVFGDADVPADNDELPCGREFPTREALCACVTAVLNKQEQEESGAAATCAAVRNLSADGKLAVLEVSAGTVRERFLGDLRAGHAQLIRRIGRSTAANPRFGLGMKGTMESTLGATEQRPSEKPPLVVQRWTQTTSMPTEMASLAEIHAWETRTESWVAYCVPPSAQAPEPRCNVNALVELVVEQSGQLPGQKPFSKKTVTKTKAKIAEGDITLSVVQGKAADLPNDSVGTFQL